jgi:hypothetical protein
VKSDDGSDDDSAGQAGDTSTGGSSTGGKGGSTTGGSTTGGSTTGGSTTGGSTTGGSTTGGSTTGGTGGTIVMPECDPPSGELDNTPYPNCTATAGNSCEECIETSCCDESMACYGYEPGNVCGYPQGDSEIECYLDCAQQYVEENGVYDDGAIDMCTGMCANADCDGNIGNATQDLVTCIQDNCEDACWPAP